MHGVLIGHSYVRRIRRELGPRSHTNRDIDFKDRNCMAAREMSTNLGLINCVNYMYTLSSGINMFEDLPQGAINRDFIVINMGSNDLASLNFRSASYCRHLAWKYVNWALSTGASNIVFIGVLKRSGRITCSKDTFDYNRSAFNKYLRHISMKYENVTYKKLRGFETTKDKKPLDINQWSLDGIHPSSMEFYGKRLAFAVKDCSLHSAQ